MTKIILFFELISFANEIDLYPEIKQMECNIIKAPRPNSIDDPMFDAANVLKVGDKLVYSLSHSANEAGATWLQEQVGTAFEVIKWHEVKYKITERDLFVEIDQENKHIDRHTFYCLSEIY